MIILLCGPAGAGKTTIATRLMGELRGARLLSSDWFKRRVYERMFREAEKHLGGGGHLILDATFYRASYRQRLMETASGRERVVTVFVDCPLRTCLERNRARRNPIPEEAIHIIWSQFERPEGPDIYVNTGEVGVEAAVDLILRELRRIESETPGGRPQVGARESAGGPPPKGKNKGGIAESTSSVP